MKRRAGFWNRRTRGSTRHTILFKLLWSACVLSAIGLIFAVHATANSGELIVTDVIENSEIPGMTRTRIRVDGAASSIGYCAQGWLVTPPKGQTLEYFGSLEIPELDYVLYHGYDGTSITSLYGLDDLRSEGATAAAVWLAIGEQREDVLTHTPASGKPYHGNKLYLERWQRIEDQAVKDAAWNLYQAGLAYKDAGGGGDEEGCAELWINRTKRNEIGTLDYQCLVTANKHVTVTFTKVSLDLSLSEGNGEYSVAGASYDIFRQEDGAPAGQVTTDQSGRTSLQLEPNTPYYALETKAPAGFLLNPKRIEFATGTEPSSVELPDKPASFSLTVSKRDAATNADAQPGLSFAGAEYSLVSTSLPSFQQTATTDDNGIAVFHDIPLGTVRIVEVKAPRGYALDPTVHEYTVHPDDLDGNGTLNLIPEQDFIETPEAFDIEVTKFADEGGNKSELKNPVGGVTFQIISNDTGDVVGTITTGEDGRASTAGLWLGKGDRPENAHGAIPLNRDGYTVHEDPETTPEGFSPVEDWTIPADNMSDGTMLHYIVDNHVRQGRLQLVKRDAESGERIELPGFTFQLLDENGNPISQDAWYPNHTEQSSFTTDETGCVTLPEPLKTGHYRIHEVAAGSPYLTNGEDIEFSIDRDTGDTVTAVDIQDAQARGRAMIRKFCTDDGNALAGAEFDVIATEDIVAPDGRTQALSGQTVGHVTTGSGGSAQTDPLYLGSGSASYAFVETHAPEGHALDATPIPFTLSYRDQNTPIVETDVQAHDRPTEVVLHKTKSGTDNSLEGATFLVWRAEDEQALQDDGTPVLNDDAASFELTTDRDGQATAFHLAPGTWKVMETGAPKGYVAPAEIKMFFVDENGLIDGSASLDLPIENDSTKLDISKRDAATEQIIPGAKLALYTESGDLVESWTSEDEPRRIECLEPGSYRLAEMTSPRDYDPAAAVDFTLEATTDPQHIELYDQPIHVAGEVDKRQEIAQPIARDTEADEGGANRAPTRASSTGLFSYSVDFRNTSSTWVDEFTLTDELEGAEKGLVRLASITTPQASGDYDGKLNVWYRLDTADDRETLEEGGANATLSDGHENPWLNDDGVLTDLGPDRRVTDYTGWHLWAHDVNARVSTTLNVSDLGLAESDRITQIRLEYGCVDNTFTTRSSDWDRTDLKDIHDDLATVASSYRNDPLASGAKTFHAPLIVRMEATDDYRADTDLANKARLELYRNGGGLGLQGSDEDRVSQSPRDMSRPLAKTAAGPFGALLIATVGVLCTFAWKKIGRR